VPAEIALARYFGGGPIKRASVERAEAAWVHGRGANPAFDRFRGAKIAIIGCGSIGAAVAMLLAQSGIGSFVLIDPERLAWANIGRHPLGAGYSSNRSTKTICPFRIFRRASAIPPLYLKGVTLDERGIPVAFDGPRLNDLAARLPRLAERQEISVQAVSSLFRRIRAERLTAALRRRQSDPSGCSRHRHPCFAKMVLPDGRTGLRDRRRVSETGGARRFAISAKPA
jgi:hypothetical protein